MSEEELNSLEAANGRGRHTGDGISEDPGRQKQRAAHLVFGFPFLLGSPFLFLSLFPPLALHAPMGFLIIGIAVMLLPFLLPPSFVRFGGILRLLPSVVLQLSFFQFSILPVKRTGTFNSPYSKKIKGK